MKQRRSCIVCRKRLEKRQLLRFVWQAGELVLDEEQRQPGRGGYCHDEVSCLSRCASTRIWERALRLAAGTIPAESLRELFAGLSAKKGLPAEKGRNGNRSGKIRFI